MNHSEFFNLFGKAIYHIDAIYSEFAKKSNITPTLLWILYALNDGQAHTQKDICFDWSLPKSTVNTLIMELKENKNVELVPIKGKRRDMEIVLTKKGKEFADSALKKIYEIEIDVFNKLGFDQSDFINKLQRLEGLVEEKR